MGPLMLAAALKVPVIFFAGLFVRDRVYSIHFEQCPEPPAGNPRSISDGDMRRWMQDYADRLERHCRESPYNWFNFYDFWAR
jgi:predicted LPLAT superfamily acyltransferase